MKVDLSYLGHSRVEATGDSATVRLAPNLGRARTFFDGQLKDPVRFREAISALHDVVVGDGRFQRPDKAAYEAWKVEQAKEEAALRKSVAELARQEALRTNRWEKVPPDLEAQFRKAHRRYWKARQDWTAELRSNDPAMFRALVPCDPVVTVAPDSVFFEAFSKDESSYGCLLVNRDAFDGAQDAGLGTTNVDYSQALYAHFQTLRTYRHTRLLVDPQGFEVKVGGHAELREEKIDLPGSWLRGFGQLQAAMALPSRRVSLTVEAVYSILAFLKRNREKGGPRSIRFNLAPGRPADITLEPWDRAVDNHALPYGGAAPEQVRVWGRRRLMVLARVLPLAERVEVQLLGTGLPSLWTVHMGDMRFVLALSGWTARDWSGGASLQFLAGAREADVPLTARVATQLETEKLSTLESLAAALASPRDKVLPALYQLACSGQVMADVSAGLYRWRPALQVPLNDAALGPEPEEVVAGQRAARERTVRLERHEAMDRGRRLLLGKVGGTSCEFILDADGVMHRARCTCHHFHRNGLRAGPCRHLLALRLTAERAPDAQQGSVSH